MAPLSRCLPPRFPDLENGGLAKDGKSVTWKLKQGVTWA
jgi:peptide/nickel transport system substrate-binding protein